VEVLVVSIDTVDTHRKMHERGLARMVPGGALYPMISDTDGAIGSLFGVYDAAEKVERRSHFLIDPEGTIQATETVAAPIGRNVAEILRQLRALQHHRATGDFMPCGWQPGRVTLTEANDNVTETRKIWDDWKPRNAF